MKFLPFLFLLLFLASCEDKVEQEPTPTPVTVEDEKPIVVTPSEIDLSGAKEINLWATMYYMKEVEAVTSGVPLRDMSDKVIGPKLSAKVWCLGAIEGTVRVEGVTYNYAGTKYPKQADCSHSASSRVRWKVSKYEYGVGNRSNPLRPFKSIAVDTSVIPNGTEVYIPEAKGVKYTFEGKELVHDGIFFADDVGGAIKGTHIDVYLGSVKGGLEGALKVNPFKFIKSSSSGTFKAYLLK